MIFLQCLACFAAVSEVRIRYQGGPILANGPSEAKESGLEFSGGP